MCVCVAQPLSGPGARGRPGTELISRAGPLHKGALGFFLENQQQEEAGEARLLARAIGPCQGGGPRAGPQRWACMQTATSELGDCAQSANVTS